MTTKNCLVIFRKYYIQIALLIKEDGTKQVGIWLEEIIVLPKVYGVILYGLVEDLCSENKENGLGE